jgi:hypothetical protein
LNKSLLRKPATSLFPIHVFDLRGGQRCRRKIIIGKWQLVQRTDSAQDVTSLLELTQSGSLLTGTLSTLKARHSPSLTDTESGMRSNSLPSERVALEDQDHYIRTRLRQTVLRKRQNE